MPKFILLFLAALFFVSCSNQSEKKLNEKKSLLFQIKEAEKKLYNDSLFQIDINVADMAVLLYNRFVNSYPDDSVSPEFLFRAGEICKNLNKGETALKYYSRIEENYPLYAKIHLVILMQGFVYEEQLKNYDKAKEYYLKFIEKYPESPLSGDVKIIIGNLGKSEEEIFESFGKNNGPA